jgi:hypothetical protein
MLSKLLVLLAMLAAVLACSVSPALADDDDDDDDGGGSSTGIVDYTVGNGVALFEVAPDTFRESTFDFEAQSGPNGELASGFATLTSAAGNLYVGPVTCLHVAGNRAVFEVDNTVGEDVVVYVGDFGIGVNVDEFNFDHIGLADTSCPGVADREDSVVVGDIEVGDNAPPRRRGDDDDDDDGGGGGLGGGGGDDDDDGRGLGGGVGGGGDGLL